MSEEKWVCTACPGWGDHEFCAIKTVVKDGKIIRTEAVDYQGAEANEGHCCQKGIASWRQVYAEDRLLYPLKRAGERGSGKWDRITWDQAFDEIGAKMLELREKTCARSYASTRCSSPRDSSTSSTRTRTRSSEGGYGGRSRQAR